MTIFGVALIFQILSFVGIVPELNVMVWTYLVGLGGTLLALAYNVLELLALVQRLAEENRSLRQSQDTLIGERANLLAKNEQARSRVEAMISRLRALEQNG